MTKGYRKKISSLFCFFTIFCLSPNNIFAAGLEVQYPSISGQTIEAGVKLPEFVTYLFKVGMFLGFFSVFVSLTIAGIMYFLAPLSANFRANAKDRISGAISGLLILVLTYLIITTINPQLGFFAFDTLPPGPPAQTEKKAPGVYLYNSGCSDKNVPPNTSTILDLGPQQRNRVGSIDIVQNYESQTFYISILYDNPNLWGKCQYINPNMPCQSVDKFATSASIHLYDPNPNTDGVYFFRKSCFNKASSGTSNVAALINYCKKNGGGWYEVDNRDIKGIFSGDKSKLEGLVFNDVPEDEQNCVGYNDAGECTKREPQNLGGENISSVIVNGNYLVLFVYQGPGGTASGPWTFCQEFPTPSDTNKLGPQQMKWQNIRNSNVGVIPNYVIIIPIKK